MRSFSNKITKRIIQESVGSDKLLSDQGIRSMLTTGVTTVSMLAGLLYFSYMIEGSWISSTLHMALCKYYVKSPLGGEGVCHICDPVLQLVLIYGHLYVKQVIRFTLMILVFIGSLFKACICNSLKDLGS